MPRVALGIQYDGRGWLGWQSQPSGHTIQNALEGAISTFADGPVRVHAAGRTDAGVHATDQVVHFDTEVVRPMTGWVRGVNRYLPSSIAVRWSMPVDETFHARFSAVSRSYCYVLYSHPIRAPHLAGRAGWEFRALAVEPMQEAADRLIGEHDFSAFRSAECQAKTPVKTLHRLRIVRRGDLLMFDFHANAFLHHMVRNLVGSLLVVGKGNRPAAWISELIEGRDRSVAAPTFMPDGLYLTAVEYPAHFSLPAPEGVGAAFPGLAS
jgi:tRNA pseudouridine38-40 synthase